MTAMTAFARSRGPNAAGHPPVRLRASPVMSLRGGVFRRAEDIRASSHPPHLHFLSSDAAESFRTATPCAPLRCDCLVNIVTERLLQMGIAANGRHRVKMKPLDGLFSLVQCLVKITINIAPGGGKREEREVGPDM
jgi:hypothetical protein